MVTSTEPSRVQTVRRVYLDMCALNRPLDDQNQMRIRLEADAVSLILSHVRTQTICLLVSPVHRNETAASPDMAKRTHMQLLLAEIGTEMVADVSQARRRAEHLYQFGLGPADAAHVAFAELGGCDFVTVDDRLLRQLSRVGPGIWFGTPMAYCDREELV